MGERTRPTLGEIVMSGLPSVLCSPQLEHSSLCLCRRSHLPLARSWQLLAPNDAHRVPHPTLPFPLAREVGALS